MKINIAHVSDFHASGSWFDEEAFEKGLKLVNDRNVDQVIFTGDLTDHGLPAEYEKTLPLLGRFLAPVSCVMGNHDAMREGWRIFIEKLLDGNRYYAKPLGEFQFIGLDSAEPDVNEGHIGREQMSWFRKNAPGQPTLVALHHHVIPVPFTGRERNILLDSGDLLLALDECKIPLVFTGHKHQPWAWRVNDTVISTTGTFCSKKTNCGQSFNHIQIDGDELLIENIDIQTGEARVLGRWNLPTLIP
jgi:Icc protein